MIGIPEKGLRPIIRHFGSTDRPNKWGGIPGPGIAPNLTLFTSVLQGRNFVMDLSRLALGWQRKIRLQGGYWQATFRVEAPLPTLMEYFYNWLGWHIEESVLGAKTWEGMVYEMTLNTPNASRTKSFDDMFNHVRTKYVDGAGADQITAASLAQPSIDRWGRKEDITDASKFDATAAGYMAATYMGEHCWPKAKPVASGGENAYSLDVIVCGYIFTANWRHTTTADDATDTVHDWIVDIIDDDCDTYLVEGIIYNNTSSVERSIDGYERCWSLIQRLVDIGDINGLLHRAYVGNDRKFYYGLVTTAPELYIVKGKLVTNMEELAEVNPWFVQPGVIRDMDYPVSYAEPNSQLADMRDIIVEEVTVGATSGLSWQALDYSEESHWLAVLREGLNWKPPGGSSTQEVERTITDAMLAKMGVTRKKWGRMTPAQRQKLKRKL